MPNIQTPIGWPLYAEYFGKMFYFNRYEDRSFADELEDYIKNLKAFIEELNNHNIQYRTDEDFEEEGEPLSESVTIKKIVSSKDLLDFSTVLQKYKNKIFLTVKGRNKFELELTDKTLIDKDKAVKNMFSESAFQEQQPEINEAEIDIPKNSELILSNQYGKIYKSINKGKEYFYAVDKNGNTKTLEDKSSALTYLKKQGN